MLCVINIPWKQEIISSSNAPWPDLAGPTFPRRPSSSSELVAAAIQDVAELDGEGGAGRPGGGAGAGSGADGGRQEAGEAAGEGSGSDAADPDAVGAQEPRGGPCAAGGPKPGVGPSASERPPLGAPIGTGDDGESAGGGTW